MEKKILLVFEKSDIDTASSISEELRRAFDAEAGLDLSVAMFPSEADAMRALLPGDFALVIVPLQIRQSASSGLNEDEERGVHLMAWMSEKGLNIPSIIVTPAPSDKLREAQPKLYRCNEVHTGGTMYQDIAKLALEVVKGTQARYLEVEIQLRDTKQWNYKFVGRGFPYSPPEDVLPIDEKTLTALRKDSEMIGELAGMWKDMLDSVGQTLSDAVLRDKSFVSYLTEGLLASGGLPVTWTDKLEENARLRFVVNREFHGLLLEAIPCLRSKSEYWMLKAPVYRRLLTEQPGAATSLFQDGDPINCLIIESDAYGYVEIDDHTIRLEQALSVADECSWLYGWLDRNRSAFNLGRVEWVKSEPGKPPLEKRVQELLEGSEWGIVHYAGHSYYNPTANAGYVFFSGNGRPIQIDITKFSNWLRRSTLVYLSSCKSGSGPFMYELASRRVSNLVGFRWQIDDQLAMKYSQKFYSSLFGEKSLERGFLKARQAMHDAYPAEKIWATPLLIMQ